MEGYLLSICVLCMYAYTYACVSLFMYVYRYASMSVCTNLSPEEGNSNPLQYSCLEKLTNRGAWWATVHGVTKSQTWLSDWAQIHVYGYRLFISVQSVLSDSLRPHEPQHTRPPCPSPTLRVYPNSRPLSQWCHLTISSSVVPFSSCHQSFPTSRSFQMSQLFTSGGQNIGVSASTSVLPMNTQDWSPLGWTGWISLQSKGLSRVFSNTTVQKHQLFGAQLSSQSNSHIHTWLLEKP